MFPSWCYVSEVVCSPRGANYAFKVSVPLDYNASFPHPIGLEAPAIAAADMQLQGTFRVNPRSFCPSLSRVSVV